MNPQQIERIEQFFNQNKQFVLEGYYRIRTLSDTKKELSYLVPNPCGDTVIHPQITIEKQGENWVPIQLLDLYATPIQNIRRQLETADFLDQSLDQLVGDFEKAISMLHK